MKTWKIENASNQRVKLVVNLGPGSSRGLLLNPGQFCIAQAKKTPTIDAQIRRKLLSIDEIFDNSIFNFNMGEVYDLSAFVSKKEELDKMAEAKLDAENYTNL